VSRLRLVVAAVALGALTTPAAAVPTLDQVQYAQGSFSFYSRKTGATYLVDVEARLSRAGVSLNAGAVTVAIRTCAGGIRCSRPTTYRAAITSANFSVEPDLSSGFLSVPLFGKPLALTWQGAISQPLPGYELDQATPRLGARVYQVTRAKGLVAGRPCEVKEGTLAQEVRLDAAPPPAAKALPTRAPKALAGLLTGVCATILAEGP
jgi:hypothetical protein